MAITAGALPRRQADAESVPFGSYTALAESAWMGGAQATDVLDAARAGRSMPRRIVWPRMPPIRLRGLLTREFSIGEAAFILMASFFLSAMLGAVRQVLFNAQFGAGQQANAYYAAFRLPDTLFSLIAGGALSSAMIPVLIGVRRDDGEAAGQRLAGLVLTLLLAVFSLIVVAGQILAPAFVTRILAPGFDAETSDLTVTLTRIMLMQPLILAVGSVATAMLNSRNQFLLTALSVMSYNIALIAGILAARAIPGLGIYGPTLGVIGGAVLQVLILLPGLLARGSRLRLAWHPGDARLREVVRLLIPNGLAVGVGYAGFILDTAFASKAEETAALPAIQNAWLLVGLPIALLGQAVGQAAFPRLAGHAAALEWRAMRRTLFVALASVIGLALPALLALLVLGRETIRILFERGKFDAAAGSLTYDVLAVYALALPAYVATEVVTRGLIALRDTRTPLVTNLVQTAGRAAIMAALIGSVGAVAVPLAFAVTAALEMVVLAAILLARVQRRLTIPTPAG
ncbi:MAG: murein biosynthesis integral membrane protein MurJ [Dehalococcoidia bacterium]